MDEDETGVRVTGHCMKRPYVKRSILASAAAWLPPLSASH